MRKFAIVFVVALFGCATVGEALSGMGKGSRIPGAGVTRTFAEGWGCDYEEVRQSAQEKQKALKWNEIAYTPRTGWTVCDLMAHMGAPDNVRRTATANRQSAQWYWYSSDLFKHTGVFLDHTYNGWIVSFVSR